MGFMVASGSRRCGAWRGRLAWRCRNRRRGAASERSPVSASTLNNPKPYSNERIGPEVTVSGCICEDCYGNPLVLLGHCRTFRWGVAWVEIDHDQSVAPSMPHHTSGRLLNIHREPVRNATGLLGAAEQPGGRRPALEVLFLQDAGLSGHTGTLLKLGKWIAANSAATRLAAAIDIANNAATKIRLKVVWCRPARTMRSLTDPAYGAHRPGRGVQPLG
jgi:hypothetical protein